MSFTIVWLTIATFLSCSTVRASGKGEGRPKAPSGYVDYYPGTGLNVILSGPHGGDEQPDSIPDRDAGCWDGSQCIWSHTCGAKDFESCTAGTSKDNYTFELTMELRQALCDHFGACPATVVLRLHRIKLDANREINEATFGVPEAVDVFNEYHDYINQAKSNITGMGLFLDVHGNNHTIQRTELGYLVSGDDLDTIWIDPDTTSIRSLAHYVGGDFDVLLRGSQSLGGFLEAEGFESVPSPTNSGPAGDPYVPGGYNIEVHGSRDSGEIDGIQVEPTSDFREPSRRDEYVVGLTNAIANYLTTNYPSGEASLKAVGETNGAAVKCRHSFLASTVYLMISCLLVFQLVR